MSHKRGGDQGSAPQGGSTHWGEAGGGAGVGLPAAAGEAGGEVGDLIGATDRADGGGVAAAVTHALGVWSVP